MLERVHLKIVREAWANLRFTLEFGRDARVAYCHVKAGIADNAHSTKFFA